jgi:hypothetical protein
MGDRLHLHEGLLYQHRRTFDFVESDHGALADQLRRCRDGRNRRDGFRRALVDTLAFLRRHLISVAVLLIVLAAVSSLAF